MSLIADLTASVNAVRPGRTRMRNFDMPLAIAASTLLLLGLLMVYSASIALADGPRYASYGRYYFVIRHGLFISAGLVAAAVVLAVPIRVWQRLAVPLFVVAMVLLVAVLIPGIGREVNGAHRWIPLGPLNFQPSELMKLAALLYAADYTVRKQEHMQAFARGFLPMAFALAGVGMLLLLEPDLGAFMVIVAIAIGILFLGGINGKYFSSLLAVLVGTFLMLIWLSPWRRARLFAYLDPWNEDNAYGSAYQLSHSLIALGRGEWLGVGLGASVEKLHYLPEAHTDFLMAVVGEELGFAGVMLVISLFAIIVYRGFDIGRQAIAMERTFAGLVAHGVAMWFGVQAFINMGVCLGLLPTKGLTLPLMSYGGSGVVMNLCALAMLIRVDVENRIMMRGDGYDRVVAHHPHHGRRHRRPHHARPGRGRCAAPARLARAVAGQSRQDGRQAGAAARHRAGAAAFRRRARQGRGCTAEAAVPAGARLCAGLVAVVGGAAGRSAGHGRLCRLSRRRHRGATRHAAGGARTERRGRHRQQVAGAHGPSRLEWFSRRAAQGRGHG